MLVFLPVSQEQLPGKPVLAEMSYSGVISNKRKGATQPTCVSVLAVSQQEKPLPLRIVILFLKTWASGDGT